MSRSVLLLSLALAWLLAGSGCSTYFTGSVRRAGLRREAPARTRQGAARPEAGRPRRTLGGRLAQLLLPVAVVLDAAASALEAVGLVNTVIGWEAALP